MRVNQLEKLDQLLASDTSKFYDRLSMLVNMKLIELDWSTRDLAEAMDRSPRTVQRIRAGSTKNLSVGTFFRLMHALDYDLPIERLEQ